jgi:hypothetical protein
LAIAWQAPRASATQPVTCHSGGRWFVFVSEMTNHTRNEPGFLWRVILLVVGFSMAALGFSLVLSVFLVFVGLPLFIFGLALMQAQAT